MLHSIELKFSLYIMGHRWLIDFGECRMNTFLLEYKKKNVLLGTMKGSSI